ncbi:OmpA family protein [Albibacterium sp.]|uniref:OmpA family protein n=1 Tax=Albibacterium sp. TaxID=2952885 RepID=UPI002CF5BBFA|nr:OmpA family protein [Albibacterium sp.]HUH18314.1 OmpA family protein [Albibacterium sp.]
MKIKTFIISTVILIFSTLKVFSQNDSTSIINADCLKNNWYIEIGGGLQLLNSEDASKLVSSNRYTPSFSISAGKWLSPVFGFRMQIQGFKMNGLSTSRGIYLANPTDDTFLYGNNDPVRIGADFFPNGSYIHVIKYINPHFDAQFSLFNLFGERNKNYIFNLVPGIGIGYMHVFEYQGIPTADLMTSNLSLMAKYQIKDNWDVNMEVNKAIFPDPFDGRIMGRMQESNTAFTLGATYSFGAKKSVLENKTARLFKQEDDGNTEKFQDWYFDAMLGGQMAFSENTGSMDFSERISPNIALTVGKWFSPVFAGRIQVQGLKLNNLSDGSGYFNEDKTGGNTIFGNNDPVFSTTTLDELDFYRRDVSYVNMHVDIQVSLQELLNKPNESYKFDVLSAVGIGYMHVFEIDGIKAANLMTNNFSLMGKYKLNDSWDINLELQTAFYSDKHDGRITGKMHEKNMSLAIGCTYNLPGERKKSGKKKKDQAAIMQDAIIEIPTVPEMTTNNDSAIEKDVIEKNEEKEVKQMAELILVETDSKPFILTSILFSLNSKIPYSGQEIHLINVAKFLTENPNKKIRLDAYGDAGSGTDEVNMNISKQRADYIEQLLIEEYGIDTDLIEKNAMGAKEQPYKTNALNRVVIITAINQ